ncbi:hypothetical protein BDDG_02006 [Blastomyces dermatitidis ATCC 18188]|uniref:Uncharacterized protein n=1 Tax=Ajellomyces dermatitidis (strain ATCC 18188 / CBS 674.68) TaxID=653446 RepID=F2T755_AJEDA|nr:hypothetical protein BDDG_02006 [Blastomyces dermatitidis ATCC 18188]
MLALLIYASLALIVLAAWVSGSLDPCQKWLQEVVLAMMGETKASYSLKKSLTGKKLIEEENLRKIQNNLGNNLGGLFATGGPGSGLGAAVGKAL